MDIFDQIIWPLCGFLIVAVSANKIAKYFTKIKLPLITGLLLVGILAGKFGSQILVKKEGLDDGGVGGIDNLKFLNEIALAFIAFAAGSELYLKEIRGQFKSIMWNTVGQLIVTFGIGVAGVFFLADHIDFMQGMTTGSKLAVGMLFATIFVARSPSSAIAVINELRAKGPFTSTAIGVTVVKDVLVIILFTVCFALSKTMIKGEEFNIMVVVYLVLELVASFGLGYLLGKFLSWGFKFKINQYLKTSLLIALGYSVYLLGHWVQDFSMGILGHKFYLEPLLICIIASFIVTNYSTSRPEFSKILHETGPLIYVIFFTLTGAALDLEVLVQVFTIALAFFGIRLLGMVLGGYIGGTLAKDPWQYRHLNWMPYVTQAGVGLGLATLIAAEYGEGLGAWGPKFETIVIGVIVINQVLGPPLFKFALHKVGESHERHEAPESDGVKDAIIFGYESMSLALARQLKSKGWMVKIAAMRKKDEIELVDDIDIELVDGISLDCLNKLKPDKTEAIILMLSDRENYKWCELIYEHIGTRDVIVRLNEDRYYKEKFHELGALVVDPSTAMVSLMDHFVRSPNATSLLLGMEDEQDTLDVEIMDPAIQGLALRELRLPADIIILSIRRKDQMIVSHGYTRLRVGDIVTMVGEKESLEKVQLLLGE